MEFNILIKYAFLNLEPTFKLFANISVHWFIIITISTSSFGGCLAFILVRFLVFLYFSITGTRVQAFNTSSITSSYHSSLHDNQNLEAIDTNTHDTGNGLNVILDINNEDNHIARCYNEQQIVTVDQFQCNICFEQLKCLSGLKQHITKMHAAK